MYLRHPLLEDSEPVAQEMFAPGECLLTCGSDDVAINAGGYATRTRVFRNHLLEPVTVEVGRNDPVGAGPLGHATERIALGRARTTDSDDAKRRTPASLVVATPPCPPPSPKPSRRFLAATATGGNRCSQGWRVGKGLQHQLGLRR